MLFTSPSFMFLFLPLALIFYTVIGKSYRPVALGVISGAFQVLLHLSNPIGMLYLPLLTLYTYLGGKLMRRFRALPLAVTVCVLPYLALLAARFFAYVSWEGFVYPVGFTVAVIFSTSYLITQRKSLAGEVGNAFHLFLYLFFFPVMLVGPILRFSDFVEITKKENLSFDVSHAASGARLFMIGFLKRIAVGAVLYESYHMLLGLFSDTPDFTVSVYLIVLIYFATFFTISGYLDMGTGIAWMFGVSLPLERPSNPLRASNVYAYLKNLFGGLLSWVDDYVVLPVAHRMGKNLSALYRSFCYSFFFFLFVRSTAVSLILIPVVALLLFAHERFRMREKISKSSALRGLCALLTVAAMSGVWIFITMGSAEGVLSYIESIVVDNPEYRINQILTRFSFLKYLFVVAIGVFTVFAGRIEFRLRRREDSLQERTVGVKEILLLGLLLVLFVFAVLIFLPNYTAYDSVPFLHLYI